VTTRRRRTRGWMAVLALLAVTGCGAPAPAAGEPEAAAPAAATEPGVPTVTADEIQALVAGHAGKVVVVNFWATWCPPCRTEFPDIVAVHDDYHARGLEVVAVSMNEADETGDIDLFLEEFPPSFPVYRAASVERELYEAVTDDWFGELPITLVFDTQGHRVHFHKRAVTYDGLAADIEPLLPQAAG